MQSCVGMMTHWNTHTSAYVPTNTGDILQGFIVLPNEIIGVSDTSAVWGV